MNGLQLNFDNLSIDRLKQQFNKIIEDLNKNGKIDLKLNTALIKENLMKTTSDIDKVVEKYKQLGTVSDIKQHFDDNGNLDSFIIKLERTKGLLETIKYEGVSSGSIDASRTGITYPTEFKVSGITQTDNRIKLAQKMAEAEIKAEDEVQSAIAKTIQERERLNLLDKNKQIDASNKSLEQEVIDRQKIQDAISNTIKKREEENRVLEKSQAKATNKALDEQYQAEVKEANRISNLGVSKATIDPSVFTKSDEELKKYIQTLYDANAKVINLNRSYDEEGTAVVKATVNTKNHRGEIESEQIILDKNSESVYKNSSAIKEMDTSMSGLKARLTNAVQSFLSFTVVMGGFYTAIHQVQQGISFINDLNTAQTNIQMITGKSSQDVQQLTKDYSDLASQLHETTSSIMTASTEFLRAGNNEKDTAELLKSSTVMSKIAGQSQQESAQSLISIQNAYKLSASDMMGVVDKMVAVDNTSATSTAELSAAIQKVASSASNAKVTLPELISYIGTISSVTRQSADTIGTAITFGGLVIYITKKILSNIWRISRDGQRLGR